MNSPLIVVVVRERDPPRRTQPFRTPRTEGGAGTSRTPSSIIDLSFRGEIAQSFYFTPEDEISMRKKT